MDPHYLSTGTRCHCGFSVHKKYIYTHTHTNKHTRVKDGWVGVNSAFHKYTACVIVYEEEGGRIWRIHTR